MELVLGGRSEFAPEGSPESPFAAFAEFSERPTTPLASSIALASGLAPFAELDGPSGGNDEQIDELLGELRDERFEAAVAGLAEETEQAVDERFQGEAALYAPDRERFARSWLAPLQFEAEQYLSALESGLTEVSVGELGEDELDARLDAFDPQIGGLSPAGEEFIGALVRKAKKVVRSVAKVAKTAVKVAVPLLSPLLAPVLKRLRGLIQPLLERVLRFAIGRLPAPLQPAARTLAQRLLKAVPNAPAPAAPPQAVAPAVTPTVSTDAGADVDPAPADAPVVDAPPMAPANATDTGDLVESFDLGLAEAIADPTTLEADSEAFGGEEPEAFVESHELAELAVARGALIAGLSREAGEGDIAAEIEQFAPVLLAALRVGLRLVGRPKVVSLLAGYLGKTIAPFVGPGQSGPLSRAIVDAGLKTVSLEAENADGFEGHEANPGAAALAGVIEDTMRRLAEQEEWLFGQEDLAEIAVAEAFGEAAATYFPQDHIRGELQLAPSLGGAFVARLPDAVRAYAKYDRVPEVSISARTARDLPAFGGGDLAGAVRAAGGRFPLRARMHVFQARPGSTVGAMLRHDRVGRRARLGTFPLNRRAAGALLGEPGLGVRVPPRFLKSPRRLAAGQRIYVLEPLDPSLQVASPGGRAIAPGRVWLALNTAKSRITVGFYLSEPEAQGVAQSLRSGKGPAEVLKLLTATYRSFAQQASETGASGPAVGEEGFDGEDLETFVARRGGALPQGFAAVLRKQIGAWALPAIADWLRGHADDFERAAAHPDPGVRLRVRLEGVPGLAKLGPGAGVPTLAVFTRMLAGKPTATIVVASGSGRK